MKWYVRGSDKTESTPKTTEPGLRVRTKRSRTKPSLQQNRIFTWRTESDKILSGDQNGLPNEFQLHIFCTFGKYLPSESQTDLTRYMGNNFGEIFG